MNGCCSSAFYDQHMEAFKAPEIQSTPMEDLILQMRSMGITDLETFPFPTSPSPIAIKNANNLLFNLGATTSSPKANTIELTELGRLLGRFPIK
jgi:HrpA-like RNA helicase